MTPAGLDLDYDDDAAAIAAAARSLCERRADEPDAAPPGGLWAALAAMGVFGLADRDEGSVQALSAVMVELGRAAVRGPLLGTVVAVRLLGADDAKPLVAGESLVAVGTPPLMPWAPPATHFVECADGRAWRARPVGAVQAVETLADEPWGRCTLERIEELPEAEEALAVGDVAVASYLCGAGERLLDTATAYAGQRTQFGRTIGEFQAVAFPLADTRVHLTAAGLLARLAAHALDTETAGARTDAAIARVSASEAALAASYRAHQTLGAMGFTVEGPVARVSTLVRQVSMLATDPKDLREAVLAPHHL